MEISTTAKKIIFIGVILLVSAAIVYFYLSRNKTYQSSNIPSPTATVLTPTPETTPLASPLGGDRDEHGCIGSAGYSWCEAKKKCIRIFEEDCNSWEAIRTSLANKYKKKPEEVFFDITKENTKYAVGMVSFGQKGVEGGLVLAVKINDKWAVIYDGNGSIDCAKIKQTYQFPQDMLAGICD